MNCSPIFEHFQDNKDTSSDEHILDGIKHCNLCNKPRQIRIVALGNEYIMPIQCDCQLQISAQLEAEALEVVRKEKMRNLKKGIVDGKYRTLNFSDSDSVKIKFAVNYADNFKRYLRNNVGLLLMGGTGTGKTYAAACIANAVVEKGYSVYMAHMGYIIDRMTNLYSDDRLEYIAKLGKYSLLIIDDFGTSRDTEFIAEQIYNLIDTRYRSGKPMIITTNLSPQDLKNEELKYKRTYERIKERCHPIILNGENLRRQIANERYNSLKKELE